MRARRAAGTQRASQLLHYSLFVLSFFFNKQVLFCKSIEPLENLLKFLNDHVQNASKAISISKLESEGPPLIPLLY